MTGIGSILHATDFSASSMIAAEAARALARMHDASVALLHVLPRDASLADRQQAEVNLQVLREERFAGVDDVTCTVVAHPRAHEAICGEAVATHADLVVCGRHGQHDLAERLLGSTTERLIRDAPCSVLVTHPGHPEGFVRSRHLLACTDMSDASRPALEMARELADRAEGYVTLAYVYDLLPALPVLQEPYAGHEDGRLAAVVADELEKLRVGHLDGIPAECRVLRHKNTVTALCDLAGAQEVDLMVVGTHGQGGVKRLLLGSVAERLVHHAPCAVMVAR